MACKSIGLAKVSAIALAALQLHSPAAAQQPAAGLPDLEALGLEGIPGAEQMQGMAPIEVQKGTWIYPVRSGVQKSLLGDNEIGTKDGVDGDFMARSSLQAVYTAKGEPPRCDGSSKHDMRGRSRIMGMEVWTGSGPFLAENQQSRIVINQSLNHSVIYLHGDVREWVPGPNFCDDGRYVPAGTGKGFLRLDYETKSHVAPLNFMAFPHPSTVNTEQVEEACRLFEGSMFDAYRDLNRRWGFAGHTFEGPIDWSVITPIPEGFNDGEQASFADGLINSRDVVDAASQAADAVSMGRELGQAFAGAPTLARGAGGAVGWAMVQVANNYLEQSLPDPAELMMDIAQAGDAAYRSSGDPSAGRVVDRANTTVRHDGRDLHGLDVDYMIHTMIDACNNIDDLDLQSGTAYGHFSWPGGTVPLNGRGFAPGAPAAVATAPVQSTSIRDALALAASMGGANVPSAADISAALPEGYSLDAMPNTMTGQAGGGGTIAPGAPEWFISYNVDIVDEGERIATLWFDPRR